MLPSALLPHIVGGKGILIADPNTYTVGTRFCYSHGSNGKLNLKVNTGTKLQSGISSSEDPFHRILTTDNMIHISSCS